MTVSTSFIDVSLLVSILFNLVSLHLLTFSNDTNATHRALPRVFGVNVHCLVFICSVVIVMVDFSSELTPDMAAKGAREALVNKLGFKGSNSSSRSAEMEIDKLKRENEHLKRSLEQMKRSGHSDPDRAKLLEVIYA